MPSVTLHQEMNFIINKGQMTLAAVEVGGSAIVEALDCPRSVSRRLMEMGLLPETEVRVVRVAPLGDPIELRVRDYSLSLRRREAAAIRVRLTPR